MFIFGEVSKQVPIIEGVSSIQTEFPTMELGFLFIILLASGYPFSSILFDDATISVSSHQGMRAVST